MDEWFDDVFRNSPSIPKHWSEHTGATILLQHRPLNDTTNTTTGETKCAKDHRSRNEGTHFGFNYNYIVLYKRRLFCCALYERETEEERKKGKRKERFLGNAVLLSFGMLGYHSFFDAIW